MFFFTLILILYGTMIEKNNIENVAGISVLLLEIFVYILILSTTISLMQLIKVHDMLSACIFCNKFFR